MELSRVEISERFDAAKLVELARAIASTSEAVAAELGFSDSYNVFANAVDNRKWERPADAREVAAWKGQSNGFSGRSSGLSVRFDPFVDAALCAVQRNYGDGTTVLVLTDYWPWCGLKNEDFGSDWALAQIRMFFSGFNPPCGREATGINILKAVTDTPSVAEIRKHPACIERAFFQNRVLLWNYIPFARGGETISGTDGLPPMGQKADLEWIDLCEGWLACFCVAVNAKRVAFAANADVKAARAKRLNGKSRLQAGPEEKSLCHPSYRTTGWRDARPFRQLLEQSTRTIT